MEEMKQHFDEVLHYIALEKMLKFKPRKVQSLMEKFKDNATLAFGELRNSEALCKDFEVTSNTFEVTLIEAEDKLRDLQDDVKFILRSDPLYPAQLKLIKNSPYILYVRGNVTALSSKGVSVVGSRKASPEGHMRSSRAAKLLGNANFVIVSGLATGIDTAAHISAIQNGHHTTAVIGTPINQYYPKENKQLQEIIAERGTLVSQFSPLVKVQPLNFPLRNEIMSGLSLATVIVEAGETSGALIQAKFALSQGRLLYIMKNQLDKPGLEWPRKFVEAGAKSLESVEDLVNDLNKLSLVAENTVKATKQLSLL